MHCVTSQKSESLNDILVVTWKRTSCTRYLMPSLIVVNFTFCKNITSTKVAHISKIHFMTSLQDPKHVATMSLPPHMFLLHQFRQMKHQLDATLCRFYFCRVTLHVSSASAHHQEYLKLVQRPLVHVLSLQVSHHISLLGPELNQN